MSDELNGKGPLTSEELDAFITSPDEPKNNSDNEAEEKTDSKKKTDDSELANEALKITENLEQPENVDEDPALAALKAEHTALISQVTGLRQVKRTLESAIQANQNYNPDIAAAHVVNELSPLEKYAREHPDDEVPSRIMAEDAVYWRNKQTESQKMQQQNQNANTISQTLESAAQAITDKTHGVGLATMSNLGSHLLTDGDRLNILQAGSRAGAEAYETLKKRIIEAGGPAAELVKRYTSKNQAKPKVNSTKENTDVRNNANNGKAENEQQIDSYVSSSTRRIVKELGF